MREKAFILKNSFYSDPQRMIYRYPRYGELFNAWQAQRSSSSRSLFGPQEFRDLQMWSQLAWFDEEFQEHDPEIREWILRGRNFTPADQARMGEKQRTIVGAVIPEYRKLAATGQIEISTTPFYHPILPLLCDTQRGEHGASERPSAATLPLPARCAPPVGYGARVRADALRRRAGRVVAVGRFGLRRSLPDRFRSRIRMGRHG